MYLVERKQNATILHRVSYMFRYELHGFIFVSINSKTILLPKTYKKIRINGRYVRTIAKKVYIVYKTPDLFAQARTFPLSRRHKDVPAHQMCAFGMRFWANPVVCMECTLLNNRVRKAAACLSKSRTWSMNGVLLFHVRTYLVTHFSRCETYLVSR